MKASELRIGNLVQGVKYKSPWKIVCFYGESMLNVDAGGANFTYITDYEHAGSLDEFEPIPLTPEWIEQLGFKRLKGLNNNEFYSLHTGFIEFQWECFGGGIMVALDIDTITTLNCFYVHQLQNLYFALTGQELELKS